MLISFSLVCVFQARKDHSYSTTNGLFLLCVFHLRFLYFSFYARFAKLSTVTGGGTRIIVYKGVREEIKVFKGKRTPATKISGTRRTAPTVPKICCRSHPTIRLLCQMVHDSKALWLYNKISNV